MYAPVLLENAKAVNEQKTDWKITVNGAEWKQKELLITKLSV